MNNSIIQTIYYLLDKVLGAIGMGKTDLGAYILIILGAGMLTGFIDEETKQPALAWVYDNWTSIFTVAAGFLGAGVSDRLSNGRSMRAMKYERKS